LTQTKYARFAARLRFKHQSIFELEENETRRGGSLHLIPEDYGMLHFKNGKAVPGQFWHEVPPEFAAARGTDLFIGPKRHHGGFRHGGYAAGGAMDGEHTGIRRERASEYCNQMIANVRSPLGHTVWMAPVVRARLV
jgi:hypothetical protein